jgi:hypothetical protein
MNKVLASVVLAFGLGCGAPVVDEAGYVGESSAELRTFKGKCQLDANGNENGTCVVPSGQYMCAYYGDLVNCVPGRAGVAAVTVCGGWVLDNTNCNVSARDYY